MAIAARLRSAGIALVAVCLIAAPARADMEGALGLCLDTGLDLPGRVAAFEAAGWQRVEDRQAMDSALAHGVLISGLSPAQPETWAESRARSVEIAANLRSRRGYDAVNMLRRGPHAVVIEPNRAGLHTCLYLGPVSDLAAAHALMPELRIHELGGRRSISGTPPFGRLVAFSLTEDAAAAFPAPLDWAATVTTVLDRRGAD